MRPAILALLACPAAVWAHPGHGALSYHLHQEPAFWVLVATVAAFAAWRA